MINSTLVSPFTDIYQNLALEQHLARGLPPDHRVLLFFVNEPAVVFGRFQNPWVECALELLAPWGVSAARRYSGGGTVYHDRGNLNYSVIGPRGAMDILNTLSILAEVMNDNGLKARIGPRRDLFIDSHKISGSAFQLSEGFGIHHGTLLVNTDLDRLNRLLVRKPELIDRRSVPSTPSSVVNIGPISGLMDPMQWAHRIAEGFEAAWMGFSTLPISLPEPSVLADETHRLKDPQWILGPSPDTKEVHHAVSSV